MNRQIEKSKTTKPIHWLTFDDYNNLLKPSVIPNYYFHLNELCPLK